MIEYEIELKVKVKTDMGEAEKSYETSGNSTIPTEYPWQISESLNMIVKPMIEMSGEQTLNEVAGKFGAISY